MQLITLSDRDAICVNHWIFASHCSHLTLEHGRAWTQCDAARLPPPLSPLHHTSHGCWLASVLTAAFDLACVMSVGVGVGLRLK